jgi:hypothetical protein
MILEKQNERHNTHALSSNSSSSNNHSYDFEIKNKGFRNKSIKDEENTSFNSQTNIRQIAKINSILNKYNLTPYSRPINVSINKIKEKRESINRKSFFAPKNQKSLITTSEAQSTQRKKKKKKVQINDKNQTNTSFFNVNNGNNTNNNKEKSEEQKKDDIAFNNLMHSETIKSENKNKKKEVIYAISYKTTNKETRFNNIQKYIDDEKKLQKKGNRKSKLLIYQQANNSLNLIRSIEKPQISFITKINKNYDTSLLGYDMFSGLRLNAKNNFCFFTKKLIRQEEFVQMEKQLKMKKYEQLKKEVEEEKIPTFSSINTSSSNSSKKLKAKRKPKTKSKTKKKTGKYQNKIKPKNISTKKKKTTILPKYKKLRSISMNSKISNEKSEDRKTVTSRMNAFTKIPNIKKKNNNIKFERRPIDIKNRKYSVLSRLPNTLFNKNKLGIKNKINSTNSLRIMKNFNSPFKNNLLKINKITEHENNKDNNSATRDKDKQNNEIDFKKF